MNRLKLPIDGFLALLIGVCVLAAIDPGLGARGGVLHIDRLMTPAVALMFFVHGVTLPLERLAAGAREVRLHLVVQGMTYLVFPLLGLCILALGGRVIPPGIAIGFFFMSTVSSTIASAVAVTGVAGGNVTGALFNASLSGILGVFLTPVFGGFVAANAGLHLSPLDAMASVAEKVLLPLFVGQVCRPLLGTMLSRYRDLASNIDKASILILVFGAFSDSVAAGIWRQQGLATIVAIGVGAVALHVVVIQLTRVAARVARLSRANEIAAVFCASQKSIANGLPIANVLFAGSPALGAIVLPLLIYHQVQLTASAAMARRYRANGVPTSP
jgi:solute carrier family 10 (sodium/bile acid cotransporter), member 7